MRKPDSVKKTKSIKKVNDYETIPEDKSRRQAIPDEDIGEFAEPFVGDTHHRRSVRILTNTLRQGVEVLKLVIGKVKEQHMILAFVGLLTGVWLSGFFANAGMRFESLLSLVLGFVFLIVVGMWSTK